KLKLVFALDFFDFFYLIGCIWFCNRFLNIVRSLFCTFYKHSVTNATIKLQIISSYFSILFYTFFQSQTVISLSFTYDFNRCFNFSLRSHLTAVLLGALEELTKW